MNLGSPNKLQEFRVRGDLIHATGCKHPRLRLKTAGVLKLYLSIQYILHCFNTGVKLGFSL
jgi:hypothetical protein